MTIVHIRSAEFPKAAIESTEKLMNEAKLEDKIDNMTTEETNTNTNGMIFKKISDVFEKAESLPAV